MPDDSILNEPWQRLTLKFLECVKCAFGVFWMGNKNLKSNCRNFITLPDNTGDRSPETELAGAGPQKWVLGASGLGFQKLH
ncbi:hypothetical protein TNCV_830761 [Trichonephila clavipes]|nr:hypothetical protein TNCV_830761 [Trichonephila clavipes]